MESYVLSKEQKQEYKALFDNGATWREVTERINEDCGTEYTPSQARERLRHTVVDKKGQEERKNVYEMIPDAYRVHYGDHTVEIAENRLSEILKLYCLTNLNINQTALKMNLTRREFIAIKTAFSITKTDMPFTPRELDRLTAEEIAEQMRIYKKRYALQSYDANKHKDIANRVKQMDSVDYWYNQIIEKSNKIDPKPYNRILTDTKDDLKCVVNLTDIHAGLEVDNVFNTYNYEVMEQSFVTLFDDICNKVPTDVEVTVAELGDTVHGIIHGSVYKHGGFMMEACFKAQVCIVNLLLGLVKEGYKVRFTKVNGSHESIEKNKKDRTEEENLGNLIYNNIKWKLEDVNNIEFIDKQKGLTFSVIPMFTYSLLCAHGDEASMKDLTKSHRLFTHCNIREVIAGHFHHRKMENLEGVSVFYNECMGGTDQYAGNKLLSSEKGTRIAMYSRQGREQEWLCRY